MTLNNMATEVAKIIGAQNDANALTAARSVIKASLQDWQNAKNWNFLLKDTSNSTAVSAPAAANGATLSANGTMIASAALDFVNVGQSVSYSGSTGTLAGGTTVTAFTRNTDGTVATVTLSNAVTGIGTTEAGTFTFSADIPIRAGTDEYNLPTDFYNPHVAYMITLKRTLVFVHYRDWFRRAPGLISTQGSVEMYTTFNPVSPNTQNHGNTRMRVMMVPGASDTLRVQYYRIMNVEATTVDIPDNYLYRLIEYAQWRFVRLKNTEDSRLPELKAAAKDALLSAMSDDEDSSDDEDVGLKSQMQMWNGDHPLWSNGQFYPHISDY